MICSNCNEEYDDSSESCPNCGTKSQEEEKKKCPYCAEWIQKDAIKCRYCAEFLNTDEAKALEAECGGDTEAVSEGQSDNILFVGRPSLWSMTGAVIKGILIICAAVFLIRFDLESVVIKPAAEAFGVGLSDNHYTIIAGYRELLMNGLVAIVVLVLLFRILLLLVWSVVLLVVVVILLRFRFLVFICIMVVIVVMFICCLMRRS